MSKMINTVISNKLIDMDTLRIDIEKGNIKLEAKLFRFRDKDTNQVVLFIPALEISAYGTTYEKAHEMLNFSISEYFDHLISLSSKRLDEELSEKGWKKNTLANKEFSKVFVSSDG